MMRPTRRQWLFWAGAGTLIGGGYVWSRFRQAVATAERRVTGRSSTIATPFGKLEYAIAGSGPPLLMIHGTGGGFDQGLRFAAALRCCAEAARAPDYRAVALWLSAQRLSGGPVACQSGRRLCRAARPSRH